MTRWRRVDESNTYVSIPRGSNPICPLTVLSKFGTGGGTRTHATGLKALQPLPIRSTPACMEARLGIEPSHSRFKACCVPISPTSYIVCGSVRQNRTGHTMLPKHSRHLAIAHYGGRGRIRTYTALGHLLLRQACLPIPSHTLSWSERMELHHHSR